MAETLDFIHPDRRGNLGESKTKLAVEFGISRQTLYRYVAGEVEDGPPASHALFLRERQGSRSGLCATCYTLKRQDEEYCGGLREAVLEQDGYRCRVCGASGRDKRSIIVHHRVPGRSVLNLMLSLCLRCHAKIHWTRVVL